MYCSDYGWSSIRSCSITGFHASKYSSCWVYCPCIQSSRDVRNSWKDIHAQRCLNRWSRTEPWARKGAEQSDQSTDQSVNWSAGHLRPDSSSFWTIDWLIDKSLLFRLGWVLKVKLQFLMCNLRFVKMSPKVCRSSTVTLWIYIILL